MLSILRIVSFILVLQPFFLTSSEELSKKQAVLYWSLDPNSLSKQYNFYKLYPETDFGQQALSKVWQLLTKNHPLENTEIKDLKLPELQLESLINIVNAKPYKTEGKLTKDQLALIETLSKNLKHKSLKGHFATRKEMLFDLQSKDIDLSRAILIYEFEKVENPLLEIRRYEASLDLMALQILARLKNESTDREKIDAISHFIFHDMQFRFPPHSLYAKDIDLYTFLPSVLDSRQGVCLGVSIIYLALAQRIGVDLEIITPPGHIYVRHNDKGDILNIETTARGINLPSEMYLGINTKYLQKRTMKEVIGMAFINKASMFWHNQNYEKAVALYEDALPYLNHDNLLKMFLGLNYLFIHKISEGKALLKQVCGKTFDGAVYPESIPEDYLNKNATIEAIKTVFAPVDETKQSILDKQKNLEKCLKKCPKFRAGLFQLAVTYLQLGRSLEAKDTLEKYYKIDPFDPTVNYYLSLLSLKRFEYEKAWLHYKKLEHILTQQNHKPRPLKDLHLQLRHLYSF